MKASIGESALDATIRSSILWLLENYASIGYPLDRGELVQLLDKRVNTDQLETILARLLKSEMIAFDIVHGWYAPKARENIFSLRLERDAITKKKLAWASNVVRLLISCPWIRAVVLTGSCALKNATEQDDIDLMLIVSPNSLYICRLYATLAMWILGVKRQRGLQVDPDKICMNVWLEADNLSVPTQKRTTYSAREILKARVVMDKDSLWNRFLDKNAWIMQKLPNAKTLLKPVLQHMQSGQNNVIFATINKLLGEIQMTYMKPHITNEIVSDNQLWLHPQVRS